MTRVQVLMQEAPPATHAEAFVRDSSASSRDNFVHITDYLISALMARSLETSGLNTVEPTLDSPIHLIEATPNIERAVKAQLVQHLVNFAKLDISLWNSGLPASNEPRISREVISLTGILESPALIESLKIRIENSLQSSLLSHSITTDIHSDPEDESWRQIEITINADADYSRLEELRRSFIDMAAQTLPEQISEHILIKVNRLARNERR